MKKGIITSEYVSCGHPDKIADQISDAILDEFIKQDENTRAGIETLVKDNVVVLGGEINSKGTVNYKEIVLKTIENLHFPLNHKLTPDNIKIVNLIGKQSEEIHSGVDKSEEEIGAGDQGFCVGFASDETDEYLPLATYISKKICRYIETVEGLGPDAKSQVTIDYNGETPKIVSILVSTMHNNNLAEVRGIVKDAIITNKIGFPSNIFDKYEIGSVPIVVNPCGEWHIGGPISDCGVTGRKIVVDQFGGYCNVGGGAFSGKDMTKVDRSAAYMARYIAKNLVAAGVCKTAKVEISYMIGVSKPSALNIEVTDCKVNVEDIITWVSEHIDITPKGIIQRFKTDEPLFYKTALKGHYGDNEYPWEKLDLVELIKGFFLS